MHMLPHVPEAHRELVIEAMDAVIAAFDPWRLDTPVDDDPYVVEESPLLDLGDDDLDWHGFLEFRRAEYMTSVPWGGNPRLRFEADREVLALTAETSDALVDLLRGRRPSEFTLSRLCGLTADVALSRSALGLGSIFWEQVFNRLQGGLIPVRWAGEWPNGHLLCIRP